MSVSEETCVIPSVPKTKESMSTSGVVGVMGFILLGCVLLSTSIGALSISLPELEFYTPICVTILVIYRRCLGCFYIIL